LDSKKRAPWIFFETLLAILVLFTTPLRAEPAPNRIDIILANGLHVVILRDSLAPIVSTDVTYFVGSRDDPPEIPGLAHAQEHMMFRGTKRLSAGALSTITTALGGNASAQTNDSTTEFTFSVPALDLPIVLRIEADRMTDILDNPFHWQAERGVLNEESAEYHSDPTVAFENLARRAAYHGTALDGDGEGTIAAFRRLSAQRMKAFYRRWYAPNNAMLVIAGDISPPATLAKVREIFSQVARRPIPRHSMIPDGLLGHRVMELRAPVSQPKIIVAYRLPGFQSSDYDAATIMQSILDKNEGPLGKFGTLNGAMNAIINADDPNENGQLVYFEMDVPSGDPNSKARKLVNFLARYADNITEDDVKKAGRRLELEGERLRDSVGNFAMNWSENALSRTRVNKSLSALEIKNFSARYFDPARALVGILRPKSPATADTDKTNVAGKKIAEHLLLAAPSATQIPTWASAALNSPQVPEARDIWREHLPNGLDIIVRPIQNTKTVRIVGDTRIHGAHSPNAIAIFYLSVMMGVSIEAGDSGDWDTSGTAGDRFDIVTSSASLENALTRFAALEITPNLTEAGLAKARNALAIPVPDYTSLGDVHRAFKKLIRPERTTIVITGAISVPQAIAAVKHTFGPWKATGTPPEPKVTSSAKAPRAKNSTLTTLSAYDTVYLSHSIPVRAGTRASRALTLGAEILGGGAVRGDANRLNRRLRENAGILYAVYSLYKQEPLSGEFSVYFDSLPTRVPAVVSAINAEIGSMRRQFVSKFELRLAKATFTRSLLLKQSSLEQISDDLLTKALNGESLNQDSIDARQTWAITANDVRSAFRKYIKPQAFSTLTAGP
jgi:zinc protease